MEDVLEQRAVSHIRVLRAVKVALRMTPSVALVALGLCVFLGGAILFEHGIAASLHAEEPA
ncbi:MAG: hypothetical protein ACRD0Z_17520 [Acidimicrobiales bacterium]